VTVAAEGVPGAAEGVPGNREIGDFSVDWHNQLALNSANIVEK
jgi:hypothetical protein